jgi:hypothetical protein
MFSPMRTGLRTKRWLHVALLIFALHCSAPGQQTIHRIQSRPVESQGIASIGYHSRTHTLQIIFKDQSVYRYAEVPKAIYKQFLAAESKGRFFHDHIRDTYRYWRVEKGQK